jgi:hypothetical protein
MPKISKKIQPYTHSLTSQQIGSLSGSDLMLPQKFLRLSALIAEKALRREFGLNALIVSAVKWPPSASVYRLRAPSGVTGRTSRNMELDSE